jgi:hypothetical protein
MGYLSDEHHCNAPLYHRYTLSIVGYDLLYVNLFAGFQF